ncbi:MAG: hypothetical protein K5929_02450 [Lachnospiraceae bacterium]|nr:hypothetical protein [Lachnospiraceae bacterium]
MGIGKGTAFWCDYQIAYGALDINDRRYVSDLFDNQNDDSPYECFWNEKAGWSYEQASCSYSVGNSSPADPNPFFGRATGKIDYNAVLTAKECKKAADRLKLAYECANEGSFNIKDYETDWSDKSLKKAAKQKKAILNSKTKIVKGDTYIQGETYTGNAYYVSNSGNDSNDGLSPQTAWATMEKVSDTKLQFGDAVFFERGGRWNGRLLMQDGVTYSAYGKGDKPIWSGSPLDCADSSKWKYYGESKDGGKIWKHTEKHTDCGIILLNNEIVCRKYYPVWNGKEYLTFDGKQQFSLKRDLSSDLMFYSDIDLTGYDVPCSTWSDKIKGNIYLRCDKGNPGDVFETIELGVAVDNITTADGGYNTIDNICYRFQSLDCNCHDNIMYQNCESCWAGGSIQSFNYENGHYVTGISGGGMLLFGNNETGRNNYIHDCESKGIAVVINGDGHHATLSRKNILAENNVVERCGMTTYMMTEFVQEGLTTVLEDVYYKNNYFINSSYGWRLHSEMWIANGWGTYGDACSGSQFHDIGRTGDVVLENNLYYGSNGTLINFSYENKKTDDATFINNKFVIPEGSIIFFSCISGDSDGSSEKYLLAIGTKKQINKAIKQTIGKKAGTIEFLKQGKK